jgi:hypothetical protein
MKIKFKAPDPRAGTIVQMDSSRGQHFIDSGSAVQVKDDDTEIDTAQADQAEAKKAAEPEPKKAADPANKAKR